MVTLLSEETLLKARNELNEIPGEKEEKVQSFRLRIQDAQHRNQLLQRARVDDRMLVRFLRIKKYNVDKAMNLYLNYYRFRRVLLTFLRCCVFE